MIGNLALITLATALLVALSSAEQKVLFRNHEQCQLPPQTGVCGTSGTVRRWYFNATTEQCQTFRWGNCGLQSNVFRSRGICERHCKTFASDEDTATDNGSAVVTNRMLEHESTYAVPMTSAPETTTSVPSTTSGITCGPIDCSQLSCTGSVVPHFDVETGCPMCICRSDETEVVEATQETSRDMVVPEIARCHPIDCSTSDEHSRCMKTVNPETGCETCNCADNVDDEADTKLSTEHPVVSPCELCDRICIDAGTIRDLSSECDVLACQCVVLTTEESNDLTPSATPCSMLTVECVCPQDQIATSTVDENGCDVCTCAAVELDAANQSDQLPPSVSTIACPDIGDCSLTCENAEAGLRFVTDENGCTVCKCQSAIQQLGDSAEPDSFIAADDDIAAAEEAVRVDDDLCPTTEPCTASCPFGYMFDKLTGCETCECLDDDSYTEDEDEIEDAVVEFAPSPPPLCQPDAGCDVDRCVRATDPQTGCDLCICDDDTGIAEAVEEYNRLSAAAEERDDVTSDTEDAVEPDGETGSATTSETDELEPDAEAGTGSDDHECVDLMACDEYCFPILDDRGCVVDCSCSGGNEDVTSYPPPDLDGSSAVDCPTYMCSCDEESGFKAVIEVNDNGCSVCSCISTSITVDPSSSDDDTEASLPEVEEERIEAVSWERVGSESIVQENVPSDTDAINEPLADARRVWCSLSPEHGPCVARLTRWYYDFSSGSCVTFRYGGCRGNVNNFVSERACRHYCKPQVSARRTEKRKLHKRILGLSRR